MFSARLILLVLICACAAPVSRRDDRRVPRGWTIDTSKQDPSAIKIIEQKAFGEGKVVLTDNFSADNLTTEATLSSTDGKKQIKHLIEEYNKLLCINKELEDAIKELEDKRCFRTSRAVERLEVHVSTSIGALRKEAEWPEFKVDIGTQNFHYTPALDGGTVIFRKKFKLEKKDGKIQDYYNMEELLDGITLVLNNNEKGQNEYINDYVEFEESFGGKFCVKRDWWTFQVVCKKEETMKTSVSIETNRLHIDRVEIYLYFADDDRPYKIFASNSSTQNPLTILGNVVRSYTVKGFKNNPHWLLHYHSAKCDAWQEDHDDSVFGKYIWDNYIKKNNLGSINIYASPLHCAGTSTVPAYVEPAIPEIGSPNDDDYIEKWLSDNADKFKPHVNNSKAECQPRTAAVIREEAIEQKKCGKEPEQPLEVPENLDTWKSEPINKKVTYLKGENNNLKISNEGLSAGIDTETGSSCFYKKPLLGGIGVKITGQMLVNVGGKLMTRGRANECFFGDVENLKGGAVDDNQVYINLGLNKQSYPIIALNSGIGQDDRFNIDEGRILETYTKNFAMRDISFVHLEKTVSEKFFTYENMNSLTYDKIFGDTTVDGVSVAVEQGIVAIHHIELSFNDNVIYSFGSPPEPREADEGTDTGINCEENDINKYLKIVLTNSNNVWVDYNVQGNEKWTDYRDKEDYSCVEEE